VSQILYAGRAVGQSRLGRADMHFADPLCELLGEAAILVLWRGTVIVVDEKEKRSGTGTPPGSTGRCKAESRDP